MCSYYDHYDWRSIALYKTTTNPSPPITVPPASYLPSQAFHGREKKTSNFTVFISRVLSDPSRIIYHRFMSCPQTTSAELLLLRRAQYLHPKHICRSKHWMMEFTCAQPKSEPKSYRQTHSLLLLASSLRSHILLRILKSHFFHFSRLCSVGRKFQIGRPKADLWSAYRLNSYLSGPETK